MQSGGSMPPFSVYRPVTVDLGLSRQVETDYTTTKTKEDKGQLTNKDLMNLLGNIKGLPSDMEQIYSRLSRFFDLQDLGISTGDLSTQYLSAMHDLKRAEFNKQEYDKAYKTVSQNKGLNEVAIGQGGYVFVRNEKNEPKPIKIETYLQDPSKYSLYTNSNLLDYRAQNKNSAYDNTVMEIVNNGIGLEQVDKLIKQYMMSLGKDEESSSQYISKKTQQRQQALQALVEKAYNGEDISSVSVDGLYKIKSLTETQARQAQEAISYIYNQLPENAKQLLHIKSGKASDKEALNYIKNVIIGQKVGMTTSSKQTIDRNLIEDTTGNKPGAKATAAKDGEDMNVATQWMLGYGNKSQFVIQNQTVDGIKTFGNDLPIVSKEGTPYGAISTIQDITKSQYTGILDWTNASIGGQKLNPETMNQVLTNDSVIHSVDMPIDLEKAQQGEIAPDFDAMQRKTKADQELREKGILMNSPEQIAEHVDEINQVYQQHQLPVAYDKTGQLIKNGAWRRFGVINAIAYDKAMGDADFDENQYLEEIKDDNRIKNITAQIKKANNWEKDGEGGFEFDEDNWYDWNGHDHYYKGTVFVPVKVDYFSAQSGSGEKLPPAYSQGIETQQQITKHKDDVKARYVDPSKL